MSMDADRQSGGIGWIFNHLPSILLQRYRYIVWTFAVLFVASVLAAFLLPTEYRSTASLLVQSQGLPSTLVEAPAAGQIEQRIARIRERVLSRGDLIQLIEQNDLYVSERRSMPLSKVVEKMRDATIVGARVNDLGTLSGGQPDTTAIDMSFDYPDAAKAQTVLQSYVNSFLSMDTEAVSDQARLSVRFLEDQADKLRAQISQIERQLTTLKARNGAALASTGGSTMIDLGSYSSQIASLENQNRQLLAQAGRPRQKDTQVAAAEAALASAQATYSDSHPDVQAARDRLRVAQQLAQNNPGEDDTGLIRGQIAANNAAIGQLQQARSSAMARAQESMAGSARAPAILEQAMQLENNVSDLRDRYKSVADNLLKAQNSARLANEQRAERLSLVEPPSLPDRPHSPNRPLLIGLGAIVGLLAGIALALAVEFLRKPLRSPLQIENLGLPVLGIVPLLGERPRSRLSALMFWKRESLA